MATHGSINAFDSSQEDWTAYIEQMEQYFAAKDVDNATKRCTILLTASGAVTYKLVRGLVAPDNPSDRSYTELVELVKGHYNPMPSAIVQRFKFNSRMRQQGENVATFVIGLKQLTEYSAFGAVLDDMLCNWLVCGIGDGKSSAAYWPNQILPSRKLSSLHRQWRPPIVMPETWGSRARTAGGWKDLAPPDLVSGPIPLPAWVRL